MGTRGPMCGFLIQHTPDFTSMLEATSVFPWCETLWGLPCWLEKVMLGWTGRGEIVLGVCPELWRRGLWWREWE